MKDLVIVPTNVQRRLIDRVYRDFHAGHDWPFAWRIDLDLEADLEPAGGLLEVCRSLGDDFIICESPATIAGKVKLRLRALDLIPEAAPEVSAFLSLCRFASAVYRSSVTQPAQVGLAAFLEYSGIAEGLGRRAFEIALIDGHFWSGGSNEHFQLNTFAPRLAVVQSVADFDAQWLKYHQRNYGAPAKGLSVGRPNTPLATKVFLSHAATDGASAQYLANLIRTADKRVTVFVASIPGHIQTGDDWFETIRGELRTATSYVVLVSQHSIERPWIWFETGAAWFSERPLLPVILPGLSKSLVPMPLAAFQMLSLGSERETEQFFFDLGVAVPDVAAVVKHLRELIIAPGAEDAPTAEIPPPAI